MSFQSIIFFIPACFTLNMVFGPNNLLSLTIGMTQGICIAVIASIGRLFAFVIMIAISAAGVGAIMAASPFMFGLVKWIGAFYLLWLGVRLFRGRSIEGGKLSSDTRYAPVRELVQRELFVAGSNPKAILIFTSFFPQFIEPDHYWKSFAMLGLIFLILEMVAILVYSYIGAKLTTLAGNTRAQLWINRVSGGFMIAFAIALVFSHPPPGV